MLKYKTLRISFTAKSYKIVTKKKTSDVPSVNNH